MNSILISVLLMAAAGGIFGVVLTFAARAFHVETDPRIEKVAEKLGGAGCGACGYPGCQALAEAIVQGKAPADACTATSRENIAAIAAIMGTEVATSEPRVARVLCQGRLGIATERYRYIGYESCRAAASLSGGPKACAFACLGMGDCVDVCHFGAISIASGIAHVDPSLCVGCGACEKVCPREAIALIPRDKTVLVLCRNSDTARQARDACMKACIGCKKCEKTCRYDAIHVVNGVAVIDRDKCTRCGECAAGCPSGCINID